MSDTTAAPAIPSRPVLDPVFGSLWPDPDTPGRPRLVGAALGVGLVAAVVLPWREPGVGTFAVLLASLAVPAVVRARSATVLDGAFLTLVIGLLSMAMLRDADWIVALSLMAGFLLGSVALARGRSFAGLAASAAAVPLAALRGMPWLTRTLAATGRPAAAWQVLRTAGLSVVLLVVFGALFASADALFARWVDALVPDLSVDGLATRAFVLVAAAGFTLCAVFVALVPPRVERLALPAGRSVRRYEWVVPVAFVVALFVVFLVAQLAALFGGHEHVRRTTGLSYADYVHQGFGQLTVVTVLTLVVIAVVARKAPRDSRSDRIWLRALLGLLCVLTLVVVASALYRMHVYEEAYGFTRLRVLVSVFEAWLGVVVLLVLAAGLRLRGSWVPLAALLAGSTMLLGLGAVNPDGYIAERNVERFEETGRLDWRYLSGLSDDALPALAALPEKYVECVLAGHEPADDDWLEWNLGRARATDVLAAEAAAGPEECQALRSW